MKTLKLQFDGVNEFEKDLEQLGTRFYFVGGCVRDLFLNRESKDLDIIIPHIKFETLCDILRKYGKVDLVGMSFPVVKFMPNGFDGEEPIDVTVPRIERSTGSGHQNFEVLFDETVTLADDLMRRDFTMNALAMDSSSNVIDLFGGVQDIKDKKIRIISPVSFTDDPLRMLRAIQFCCRFEGFDLCDKTFDSLSENHHLLSEISPERIRVEIEKGLKGNREDLYYLLRLVFDVNSITDDNLRVFDILNKLSYAEFIYVFFRKDGTQEELDRIIKDYYFTADEKEFVIALSKLNEETTAWDISVLSRKNRMLVESELVNSIIIPHLKESLSKMASGEFPLLPKDLKINGTFLMERGFQGIEIGKKQEEIMKLIYNGNLLNDENVLKEFIDG